MMYLYCFLYVCMPLLVAFSVYEKVGFAQYALLILSTFLVSISYVRSATLLKSRLAESSSFKKVHSFVCDLLCRFGGVLILLLSFDQLLLSIITMLVVVVVIFVTTPKRLAATTQNLGTTQRHR